jgi:hypothetical protein
MGNDAQGDDRLAGPEPRKAGEPAGGAKPLPDSTQPGGSLRSDRESRLNERIRRLLSQRRGPDAVMASVLCVALICGAIGFAADFMWIVAMIVMALGLGFVFADSRRNRIDVANQRAEREDGYKL